MREVCDVLEPPETPSSRSGGGTPSSRKNTAESSSSWCWPVWTSTSSWRSRSGRDTAAALTNWGRLPMTVRILMAVIRSTVQAARHLLWYVGYQIGTSRPRSA